jgi:SAM-dependent methyltransferase
MPANPSRTGFEAQHLRANREIWDEWARHHASSEFYDLEGFRRGTDHLRPHEVADVGDVRGKSLLHLQCHLGTDTLSWARRGASVVGVDFSPRSIETARHLAAATGLTGEFVTSDIYRLPDVLSGEFDIVYTSRGVIGWLPDLERWAQVVFHFLRPGGFFYLTEIHPVARMFRNDSRVRDLQFRYNYFPTDQPLRFPVERSGSYANRNDQVEERGDDMIYAWTHTMGEVVTSLATVGLRIDLLREFPFCDWELSFLQKRHSHEWVPRPEVQAQVPLSFALKATKPDATPGH